MQGFFENVLEPTCFKLDGFGAIFLRPYASFCQAGCTGGICMPWYVSMLSGSNISALFFCETGRNWN